MSNRKGVGFLNCKIDVSKKVFIPRIETEFWVKKAIREIKRNKRPLKILDIFAGTGCIGIAVLKAIKNAEVSFIDIDKEAIEQIKINLKINLPRTSSPRFAWRGRGTSSVRGRVPKERYRIYQSNLFEKLKNKKFNFIFVNPPYVALDRLNEVQKEVLEKEPHTALFAGKKGTFYIDKFFNEVKKYLKPDGVIFLEFDPFQKEEIEKILKNKGFKFVFKKDQFMKFRWLKAKVSILKNTLL